MSILALVLAFVPAITSAPRGEEPRPEIVKLVTDLETAIEKHGKDDARAIENVRLAAGAFEKCNPKERELIVKQVGRALRDPRPRPDKKSYEHQLAMTAAAALGSMGDAGAKELAPSLTLKHFRIDGELLEEATAQLGRTKAKIAIEPLLEMAGTRSVYCVRGAARGFVHWGEADGATRKKLFEALLKPMQSMADEARTGAAGGSAGMAKEVFEAARDSVYAALSALSGNADVNDIDGWVTWWNNNKNAKWDKKKG